MVYFMYDYIKSKRKEALMKKLLTYLPGFIIALLIAVSARWIESLLPIPLIGADKTK